MKRLITAIIEDVLEVQAQVNSGTFDPNTWYTLDMATINTLTAGMYCATYIDDVQDYPLFLVDSAAAGLGSNITDISTLRKGLKLMLARKLEARDVWEPYRSVGAQEGSDFLEDCDALLATLNTILPWFE